MSYRKWFSGGLVCLAMVCLLLAHGAGARADTLALPEGTKHIADEAFCGDMSLDEVLLPEGVETIGVRAFADSGVKRVYLPASLEDIADDAFAGCADVEAWGDPYTCGADFCARNGIAYTANATPLEEFTFSFPTGNTATLTKWSGDGDCVYIPETADGTHVVTAIDSSAFANRSTLKKVCFPDSVATIGSSAFSGTGLVRVELPANLREIKNNAFMGCDQLEEVEFNEGLVKIEDAAFYGCSSLREANLPDSVEYIGDWDGAPAFGNCASLTWFHYPASLGHATIGGPFRGCTSLTEYEVPEGITELTPSLFRNHVDLVSLTLPSTLKVIGNYSLRGCTGLTELNLPDSVETIGSNALSYLKLTRVELPANLKTIKNNAFEGCDLLEEVEFNEGLVKIEDAAFYGCSSLREANLPDSVEYIGDWDGAPAFGNCASLTWFHYPASLGHATIGGPFRGCTSLTEYEVPEGITELTPSLFRNHVDLVSLTLPSTLKVIGNYSLRGTSINNVALGGGRTGLTGLILPEGTEEIGSNAFNNCGSLQWLYVPESVTSIHTLNFENCGSLTIESEYGSTATAFAVTNDIPHYYLTPVGRMPSGVIYQGDPYALNLSIRSTDVIESVSIVLTDAAGQAVYQRDCAPGEAIFYFWPDISDAMDIPHLPLGEYTLTVNAATALTRESYTSRFKVKEPPLRLNTDDATLPNRYIHLQQTLNMLGTITSNYPMTSVTATLQKQDGTYSETYQAEPNDTSLALMPIANHFGVITATGPYYFTFSITGHGETVTLFDGEMMCTETYNAEEVRWDPLMSSGIDQYPAKRGFWSVELAVAAYGDGKSFARSCWFRDVHRYNHPTNIASIMMWKDTDNLDGTYTRVWCVGVQGTLTTSVDQWLSNLTVGEGRYHAGFLGATQTVLEDFRSYRAQINEAHPHVSGVEYTPNDKIWIAGHSRGAAVTNILGGDLILDEGFAADDIYAFCFACPNVMKGGDSYCNQVKVYNLDGDLVTHVAAWGYGRYGDVEHFDVRVLGNNEHLKRIPITNYSDIKPYVDMVEAIEPDSLPDLLDRVRTYVQTNNLGYALDVLDGVIIVISNANGDLALGLGEAAVDRALYVIQTPFRPYEDDVGLFDAHGRESYRTLMASRYPSFAYGDYSR